MHFSAALTPHQARELRRITDEDASAHGAIPTILSNKHAGQERQYFVVGLLGKGGFSEVYKACDIHSIVVEIDRGRRTT